MRATEAGGYKSGTHIHPSATERSPRARGCMESRSHCAYNQTRECFLGLEVAETDIRYANLDDLIAELAFRSGGGLWIVPFMGIPATGVGISLDLLYLDETCRVIDAVESGFTSRAIPAHKRAASVLALPTHTIYSSQTQPGDQLAICMAGEMEHLLQRLIDPVNHASAVQSAVLLRETPLWSGGPGLLELEDRSEKKPGPGIHQMHEMGLVEPGKNNFKAPKNWLERWWSPDPRRAPRESASGLAAYYWTGASPIPHSIRDISSTGLYVVTEERWYPGTLVLMTLQRTDGEEAREERSIYVHSRAVRWGNDGVGLQFVLPETPDSKRAKDLLVDSVDRKTLDRFLKRLWKGKR